MPYITQDLRDALDNEIKALGNAVQSLYFNRVDSRDGLMNYAITKLILHVYPQESQNYHGYNEVMGMLDSCRSEYYRRAVAPYEESKIFSNGDVYPNPIQP